MDGYTLIDDRAGLAALRGKLTAGARWTLDTEFVRERTYLPRLCLMQFGVGPEVVLLDPLAVDDTVALGELLLATGRPIVVHAARQDVEVLLPLTGKPLAPLLDTQIAAALLGLPAQIGYAQLVKELLGIELAKGHARTDWARRPLSREQLAYAADDVRHLENAASELESRLDRLGRLAWLTEDCAALADPDLYRVEPAQAWKRIKGLERMPPEARAVLCALAAWREERASRRNLPRGWIITDQALRDLAKLRPGSREELLQVPGLPGRLMAKVADELLSLIAAAPGRTDLMDQTDSADRPTPAQQAALRRLQEVLRAVASELSISPDVLATRRDLAAIVRADPSARPLSGWRQEVIGHRLLAAL